MMTPLGKIVLTINQKDRLSSLHNAKVKGFLGNEDDTYSAQSDTPLNQSEIDALVAGMQALPDVPIAQVKDKDNFKTNPLYNKTPAEIDAYITGLNISDNVAKQAIKQLALAINFLVRRSDLNK